MTLSTAKPVSTHLRSLGACSEAIAWVGKRKVLQRAWDACPRGDWLLWYAARRGVDRRTLVLAACACARTTLQYVPKGEDRPRVAIETAERWARGEATLGEVRNAAYAAYAAYAAAHAAVAAYAYAAAYAAAAYAASAAAYAASAAAAYYADAAAADRSRAKALAEMADIVRTFIPEVPK